MSLRLVFLGLAVAIAAPPALAAQNPQSGGGNIGPLCQTGCTPQYSVDVTPDGGWDPDRPQNSGPYTSDFTVTNTGSLTATYLFNCWETGGVTCSGVSPTSKRLSPSQSWTVTATYSVGSSGGELRVSAEGAAYDEGYKNISTPPNLTLVLPVASGSAATVHTRTPLVLATYFANDAPIDTTSLQVKWANEDITALARRNARLVEWEVDSTRQLSPGGSKDLYIRICNSNNGCSARTWTVTLDGSGAPLVSFRGMPLEALGRQFSAPFGPGLSVSGAEIEAGFAVPAYITMGVSRSTGLVYSTRQAYPRALVNADIELTWPSSTPDEIKAVLLDGAVRLDSLVVASPPCNATSQPRCRVTLQGDFSGSTWTGASRKWLKVEVRVTASGQTKTTVDSVEVVLADRRGTAYGAGWFPSSLLEIWTAGNDAILLGPTGTASVYRGFQGRYLSPPGDQSVLVKTGATWELRFRDASKLVFDTTTGRLTSAVDRHSNTTSYGYDGYGRLGTITDPVGRKFVFTFAGTLGGSDYVVEIVDSLPGNSSRRHSRMTFNTSRQLVYDSLASDPARAATASYAYTSYGGNYTNVVASRTDPAGNTSTVSYDARRRPTQVSLPQVPDENGSLASPVIGYRAQELRGLDTLLADSALAARISDPNGNWTRSRLNRWGAPERTWDAIGTLARAAYLPDGFVAWREGKVADSTRVHYTYDALGRLARVHRYRAAGDMVRLDSLVYNASHRVIKRINALGQRDSMVYNGLGDLITRYSPTGDITAYTWRSDGLLSTVNPPGPIGATTYSYDATFKNLYQVTSPSGLVLTTNTLDGFGRVTEARRKLLVRHHASADTMQWRRTLTAYTPLNQVDSVRAERTGDCAAPCSTPPAWPSAGETAQWQQVRRAYDRLGRDTARYRTSGVRSRYGYDALGRLRARWPFAESTAVVDSFRYDLAGNLRYHWTRRGTRIVHAYDSRNRATADSVPGLGTIRRTFGGYNDELTRAWTDGYVDSIGGVNPAVSFAYSQAGLVLTDSAQGAQVAGLQYDRYGRDSVITDLAGTWRLTYDATRGILDRVETPFSDTVDFAVDSLWRPVGLTLLNGSNPDLVTSRTFNTNGSMTDLITTHSSSAGEWTEGGEEPSITLWPAWFETRGGAPQIMMRDTLEHDGWGRVTDAYFLTDGALVANEGFAFSAEGNIRRKTEFPTYDLTTQRLTVRAGGSYSYDRAGNLVSWTTGGNTWTYSYDPLERLSAVRYNGTVVARYGYDVAGRRIVKRVYSGGPYAATVAYTRFFYRGGHVLAEADSTGSLSLAYTWGAFTDDLVAVHKYGTGAGDWYVMQDQLHSVRQLTQRDGTWTASWRYRIYGALLDSAGSAPFELRYRWTGREYDRELGFYFFRSRYYDPAALRFVQEDKIGWAGGVNLYAYGDGNPTNGRDPDGLAKAPDIEPTPSCLGTWEGCHEEFGAGAGDWDGNGVDDFDQFCAWNCLTQTERDAAYQEYQDGYQTLRRQYGSDPAYAAFFEGSTPLSNDEFGRAMSAVSERFGSNPVVGAHSMGVLIITRFALGQFFVNDPYLATRQSEFPGRRIAGYTPPGTRLTILSTWVLQEYVGQLANTLVHETLEAYSRMDECAIIARANYLSGYVPAGAPPPQCR